jgi:hypothetical protein
MDFSNLTHRIVLHCAIALIAALAVMLGFMPDTRSSLLIALIGWLAFCKAGYLILCHDKRTFGYRRHMHNVSRP